MGDSTKDSERDTGERHDEGDSAGDSVRDSARDSVRDSVKDSACETAKTVGFTFAWGPYRLRFKPGTKRQIAMSAQEFGLSKQLSVSMSPETK